MEKNKISIYISRSKENEDLPLPKYATEGSSGMDVVAAEECVLQPGEWKAVGTGLFMEIPSGYECQVRPRSGLALRDGVTVLNAPGTVDSDYRGEVKVILINHGKQPFKISRGDRIAQLVFAKVEKAELHLKEELTATVRGSGGFGSTGK
ncbi:deoxyuridine 5'-triphosphate nucleotidohydrolase Dut [Thermovirga lienii DSM 17291]|jgi:dUTP pyrophosphatase|uniref:Deoxyuridine 5'-triphosphate nucleotidohydrolase n=1 Tax=Thermovirga lienii (strain ATCC BAA-1197 / DSM 17291 / Cas60314) TaxID=580340 RepID=G7V988_THELD|nr:dUTP diphosphatase [Thermovirga lienii]AER66457.1 deoxyuridine 5'-triphosphate nucleotidohydrolase Dut [Thermovirga lienii DSM 17291]MDN5318439.1 dUTP pyrophosphatase [Thermovirga sp.]MDN5368118.1 dUTP pyrophosphatase [Thermovirga sp.]